jgi:hypothetical protein
MMKRFKCHCGKSLRCLLVPCLVAVAIGTSAYAEQPDNKGADNKAGAEKALPVLPLQLTDGAKPEISYTWREVENGMAVVSVWNDSKDQLKLSLDVTDFDLTAGSIGSGATPIRLTVSPGTATVGGYGVTRFTLKLSDPSVVPPVRGSYVGLLSFSADNAKFSPFSQRIRINVAGPEPAVTKATLFAWRLAPFCPLWWASINIPLKDEYKASEFTEPDRVVGYVHASTGGIAVVRWKELKPAQHAKPPKARLVIPRLPAAGQYESDINLGGLQDKTAPLALTVIAKDIPVFPILVMALGIALAWLTKRYLGVLRTTWLLRRQEAELGATFQESQKKFSDAVAGKPYASYSIAGDVTDQRTKILRNLKLAEGFAVTSLENNRNCNDAKTEIEALQSQLQEWAEFGSELASLEGSLDALQQHIDGAQMIPPATNRRDPKILTEVQELLRGRPLKAEEISGLRKNVSDSKTAVTQWDAANQHAQELTASLQSSQGITDLDENQKSKLTDAQNRLVAAWEHLWSADTAAAVSAITQAGRRPGSSTG